LLKGVDSLREDVDRLEARIEVVAQALAARGGQLSESKDNNGA
jgi:hypothetical protein